MRFLYFSDPSGVFPIEALDLASLPKAKAGPPRKDKFGRFQGLLLVGVGFLGNRWDSWLRMKFGNSRTNKKVSHRLEITKSSPIPSIAHFGLERHSLYLHKAKLYWPAVC